MPPTVLNKKISKDYKLRGIVRSLVRVVVTLSINTVEGE